MTTYKHSIGIVTNHFVGELDEYIGYLDNQLNFSTNYKRAVHEKDQRIFNENYVLNNFDKKEYYEKQSTAFAIEINPATGDVFNLIGYSITPVFQGNRMMLMLVGEEEPQEIIARLTF